jgi:hypothetical protein
MHEPPAPERRGMTHRRLFTLGALLCVAGCGGGDGNGGAGGNQAGSGGTTAGAGGRGGSGAGGTNTGGVSAGGAGGSGGTTGGAGSPGAGGSGSGGPDAAAAGGSGGAGTGGSGGTGTGGGGGAGGGAPDGGAPSMACSDNGPAPSPPAGFVKAEPMNMRFPFSTHFMGMFSANPRCVSMTSWSDIDNDGDQDFSSGQRDVSCTGASNPNAPMVWWEHCGPDRWVRHVVGTGYRSAAAGGAGDFDGDGWVDLVVGDSWFKNPGAGVQTAGAWMRFATGAPPDVEEITVGDVTGDGKFEVLYVVSSIMPQVWIPGANATQTWTRGPVFPYRQQQGGFIGDLDGDGRNDILVGDRYWYKQPAAAGGQWAVMNLPETSNFAPGSSANGSAPITAIADIDGDGDMDVVAQQHWGSKVAWFENTDGKGVTWTAHMIVGAGGPFAAKTRNILHGLLAADFDNDGDVDVLSGENQGMLWMYENSNGKGMFAEHVVATGPAHEARAADVDCDGDLDIAGKPWGDPNDGAAGRSETIRAHVYFKNELVERGGTPVFARPKGEVWNTPNKGRCKP